MKGNKIFDFSRVGFQQIINTMTRKINEVVEVSNGLIPTLDEYISKIDWNKIINSDLYQKVLGELGITNKKIEDIAIIAKLKSGLENKEYNTNLLQNLIDDNVAITTSDVNNAPITVPYGGAKIIIPNGEYYIGNLNIGDGIKLEGHNKNSTILLTDGIRYKKYSQNGFQSCWNFTIDNLTIKGINGNEILLGAGDYNPNGRLEHIITEVTLNDVIFDHASIGLDLRGWNNRFITCMFRDLDIGVNMDTVKMNDKSLTGNCGDNIFIGCTFNNCDIDVKMRYSYSNMFIGCAGYQADNVHFLLGEETRGNQVIGGRMEDSPNALCIVNGGHVVKYDGQNYQCIKNHTSSNDILPNNTEYWVVTTLWEGYKNWEIGKNYLTTNSINNSFNGVNCYIGKESRKGRNGKTIIRSSDFKYFKLQGDQYTKVENCFSGSYTDNKISIAKNTVNAEFRGNQSITVENNGSTSYYEEKYTFGSKVKEINTPLQYNEKINLPKNKVIAKLKQWSTNTPIMIANNSTTDVVVITPRNASASAFYGANIGNIYAICEANDKIRIYHPQPTTDDMEFNIVLL